MKIDPYCQRQRCNL